MAALALLLVEEPRRQRLLVHGSARLRRRYHAGELGLVGV